MNKKGHTKTIIIGSTIGVIVLLAAVYFGMTFYFKNHFLFRTEINGWKVGGMSVEKVEEKIAKHEDDYLLTVFDREGQKEHVYGRDIKCKYAPDGSIEKALKKQNPFGWIASVFKDTEEKVAVTMNYEEDLISGAVSAMSSFQEENIKEPVSAKIVLGEDGYQVEPETLGSHLIFENVLAKVKMAVSKGEESITLTQEDYQGPEYTVSSEKITSAMDIINKYMNAVITYQMEGIQEELGKAQLQKFITVGEDYSVSINEGEITKYVQNLASKYNTYADKRSFQTSSSDTVEIGGGDYGWIINKSEEAAQIKADLEAGQPVTREAKFSQRAFVDGADDIGKTYIEIDYTKQHLWYYENGSLVTETDIVSGNINRNNGSPDGVFKIVYKDSPAVLRGENYESNVTYFMPFAYNVGIHDASWRGVGEFGGEKYKTNGSHGCINVPLQAAETIFKSVKVGTPVIAYYREPVTLSAENCRISNAYSYVKPEKPTP
ncbi:MAG: L,D-transpeptidase family protein [Lachnospiraceae bacterium]